MKKLYKTIILEAPKGPVERVGCLKYDVDSQKALAEMDQVFTDASALGWKFVRRDEIKISGEWGGCTLFFVGLLVGLFYGSKAGSNEVANTKKQYKIVHYLLFEKDVISP
ncbi:MAG: hypothetical protein FWD49_02820 [Firmicutes bacterium]|nr:hypothetical protein [Bacillota bacterium]